MARTLNKLSPLRVQKLRRKGLHSDGGGLYLRISDSGTKGWIFRFGDSGKLHDHGLGPVHTVSLPEARGLAQECRKLRLQGIDPIAHRRAAIASRKAMQAKSMTFAECAAAYIASHEAGWRNAVHSRQWTNSLQQHVHPVIGALPVAAIDTGLVMKVIEPIWTKIPETATRLRGRVESILDWARVRGYRDGENPARWRGHLDHLLPARSKVQRVEHYAALPYAEIGSFMAELRQQTSISARALEFLILTAARRGEALEARWTEIDIPNAVWTIPASRMKADREHRVPLSGAALAVLKRMQAVRRNEFVFPGRHGQFESKALFRVLQRLGRGDITAHGFRSSFRDWASERSNFPREVAEMALAHAIGSQVEAAYRRGDLFEKRRKLMGAWAEYCDKPARTGDVVPIAARR
jgi:integrase